MNLIPDVNESKRHLSCLTELVVRFDALKNVTENFTGDATRRNCTKVKRLIVEDSTDFSEDIYRYFPSDLFLSYLNKSARYIYSH
jgi:hypothetical protein